MHQGGDDTVQAGGGDDSILFAGAYTHDDVVDGGDGNDRVNLQGDYSAGVTVDFTNVETLQLSSGGLDYKIAVAADCFAVEGGFTFDASSLEDGDSFSADLTADSAGQTVKIYDFAAQFAIKGGAANETFGYSSSVDPASGSFSGGAGDDSVTLWTGDFGASKLNGGKGFDSLILQRDGDYGFTPAMLKQFETIVMTSHSDVGFSLTMSDANVARSHSLWIDGGLTATMTFDGSAETNGAYSVTGGAGADSITGGAGADTLSGGARRTTSSTPTSRNPPAITRPTT